MASGPLNEAAIARIKRRLDAIPARLKATAHEVLKAAADELVREMMAFLGNEEVPDNYLELMLEELELEACAVAAPIFNHHHEIVAALLIAVPKHRFTATSKRSLVRTVLRYAQEMTNRLGG